MQSNSNAAGAPSRVLRDALCASLLACKIRWAETKCTSLGDYFQLAKTVTAPCRIGSISPSQKKRELVTFLNLAKKNLQIRAACEIGTYSGGATYLLSKIAQPKATLITVDLSNDWRKALVLTYLKGIRQRICVIGGDSTRATTLMHIGKILGRQRLDLLFVDGDHTYSSVSSDFMMYRELVRKGGWIALHDIVPDYRTRYGTPTESSTGDVPVFWKRIKDTFTHFEIVEDYRQDGFGIGVVVV